MGHARHIHLAGVAGVGMSALAQALASQGWQVTGSDRHLDQGTPIPVLDILQRAGIHCAPQDGSALTPSTYALVVSTAIEDDNPEIQAARKFNIPIKHRAEILAELVHGKPLLAVAGTAGKTTSTGMLGWVLEQLGANPNVVNGGAVVDWVTPDSVGNFRRGGDTSPWILELDESDQSLIRFPFAPEWSILTNISADHYDLQTVEEIFAQYAQNIRKGIICGPGVRSLLKHPPVELIEEQPEDVTCTDECVSFVWKKQPFVIPQIGEHNAWNAFLVAVLCSKLGHALPDIAEALSRFHGMQRRLEEVGRTASGIRIIDDYAHNPAKLAAAWSAVARPNNRVLGVWRPHGFGPLRNFFSEFAEAFAKSVRPRDRLWILPVYYVGGRATQDINADALVDELQKQSIPATFAPDYDDLLQDIRATAQPNDTILFMGARDPAIPAAARRLSHIFHTVENA